MKILVTGKNGQLGQSLQKLVRDSVSSHGMTGFLRSRLEFLTFVRMTGFLRSRFEIPAFAGMTGDRAGMTLPIGFKSCFR